VNQSLQVNIFTVQRQQRLRNINNNNNNNNSNNNNTHLQRAETPAHRDELELDDVHAVRRLDRDRTLDAASQHAEVAASLSPATTHRLHTHTRAHTHQ
jgi:hypothetical protein